MCQRLPAKPTSRHPHHQALRSRCSARTAAPSESTIFQLNVASSDLASRPTAVASSFETAGLRRIAFTGGRCCVDDHHAIHVVLLVGDHASPGPPLLQASAAGPAGCIVLQGLPARRPSHCGWQSDGSGGTSQSGWGTGPGRGTSPGGSPFRPTPSPLHAASGLLCKKKKAWANHVARHLRGRFSTRKWREPKWLRMMMWTVPLSV